MAPITSLENFLLEWLGEPTPRDVLPVCVLVLLLGLSLLAFIARSFVLSARLRRAGESLIQERDEWLIRGFRDGEASERGKHPAPPLPPLEVQLAREYRAGLDDLLERMENMDGTRSEVAGVINAYSAGMLQHLKNGQQVPPNGDEATMPEAAEKSPWTVQSNKGPQ